MAPAPLRSVTYWLDQWHEGADGALEQLTRLVYDDLRRLAAHYLRTRRPRIRVRLKLFLRAADFGGTGALDVARVMDRDGRAIVATTSAEISYPVYIISDCVPLPLVIHRIELARLHALDVDDELESSIGASALVLALIEKRATVPQGFDSR